MYRLLILGDRRRHLGEVWSRLGDRRRHLGEVCSGSSLCFRFGEWLRRVGDNGGVLGDGVRLSDLLTGVLGEGVRLSALLTLDLRNLRETR